MDNWVHDLNLGLDQDIKESDRGIKEVRRTAATTPTREEKLSWQKNQRELEAPVANCAGKRLPGGTKSKPCGMTSSVGWRCGRSSRRKRTPFSIVWAWSAIGRPASVTGVGAGAKLMQNLTGNCSTVSVIAWESWSREGGRDSIQEPAVGPVCRVGHGVPLPTRHPEERVKAGRRPKKRKTTKKLQHFSICWGKSRRSRQFHAGRFRRLSGRPRQLDYSFAPTA